MESTDRSSLKSINAQIINERFLFCSRINLISLYLKMIYIYKDSKDRYIISTNTIPDLQMSLLLQWNYFPYENIRPWKYLGISADLYKPEVLDYIEEWKNSKIPPPTESRREIHKEQIESILKSYQDILDTLISLNLVKESEKLKYKKYIIYECDIINYLKETVGKFAFELCEKYKALGNDKKTFLKNLSKIKGRENKLSYIKTIDIDLDIFSFLPPWFKSNYQIFGENERTIKNQTTNEIEYQGQDRVDGHIGEPLIKENIYIVFSFGEILSAKEIKERLGNLYDKLNIKRTPKVSDLYEYFNVTRTYSRLYRLGELPRS